MLAVIRIALAGGLLTAAFWKAKDFGAFRWSLDSVGLRDRSATIAASALIGAEAAVGAAALTPLSGFWLGLAALPLGAAFTMVQTHLLVTGKRVTCLCFGARSAEQVSLRTLSKAALVLLASLALVAAGPKVPPALGVLPLAGGLAVFGGLIMLYRAHAPHPSA